MSDPVVYAISAMRLSDHRVGLERSEVYLTRASADIACRDVMEKLTGEGEFVMRYPVFDNTVEQWENNKWIVSVLRLMVKG